MAKRVRFNFWVRRTDMGKEPIISRGTLMKKNMAQAVRTVQRKIRKTVTRQKVPLKVKISGGGEKFEQHYVTKQDFRKHRIRPKWRQALSRKVKYGKPVVADKWFVDLGRKRKGRYTPALTKLPYDPAKRTPLGRRKQKRLVGPFEDEAAAREFLEKAERFVE